MEYQHVNMLQQRVSVAEGYSRISLQDLPAHVARPMYVPIKTDKHTASTLENDEDKEDLFNNIFLKS